MKRILTLLLTIFVITLSNANAQADIPNLGRPETLLAEAKLGRKQLLEVLLRLKDNVKELRDQPSFDAFFALLGPLDVLAKEYSLEAIYPNAVKEVGKSLVMHGNRWLRISTDSESKILSYQKWADLTVALTFQWQVLEELNKINDDKLFKKAFTNLLSLQSWAKATYPNDLNLYPTYENTISVVSFKALMKTSVINKEEWVFWIKRLSSQEAVQSYLAFLNEKILMENFEKEELSLWFSLAETLGNQLNTIERLSNSEKNNYGSFISDLTAKAINDEVVINENSFKSIINLLNVTSLRGLIYIWVNPSKTPSDAYSLKLLSLTRTLHIRTKELKQNSFSLALDKFISSNLGPVITSPNGIEGHYNLKGRDGSQWFFTIIRETESRIIAALCDSAGSSCYSFYNITYNLDNHVFFASENVPSDDSSQNASAQIIFGTDNSISIDLPSAYKLSGRFTGKKSQSYENVMNLKNEKAEGIQGRFKGTIEIKGVTEAYNLIITNFGEYSIGRLDSEDNSIQVELNKGTNGKDGFVYLTSGRTAKGTWFHLRLKQVGSETLVGDAIVGGTGILGKARFEQYNGEENEPE